MEKDLLNSAMQSDDIVLSISSPASMCVRLDADGSVGAVSSDHEVHASGFPFSLDTWISIHRPSAMRTNPAV